MTHKPREGSIADRAIKFMEAVGGRPIKSTDLADEIDAVATSMSASMGLAVTHSLVVRGMRDEGIFYWLPGGKTLDVWRRGVDYSAAAAPVGGIEAGAEHDTDGQPASVQVQGAAELAAAVAADSGHATARLTSGAPPAPAPVILDGLTMVAVELARPPSPRLPPGPTTTGVVEVDARVAEPEAIVADDSFIVSFRSDKSLEIIDGGNRILWDQKKVQVLFQYLDLLACGSAGTAGLVDGLT